MSETITVKGSCLCGKIEVEATPTSKSVAACHCNMCRNWGGGPYFALDCSTQVKFSGEEHITSFASSEWAERGFCSQCGTHLFYKFLHNGQYMMPAGLFESLEENNAAVLTFDHQIFIEEKPEFYTFANKTKNMTGEQVFAEFSGE